MTGMGAIRRDRGTGMKPRWRKDHRWEARYVDADGRMRSVYSRTPGRAGQREAELLRDEAAGQSAAGIRPSALTLADYLDRHIARSASHWSPDTATRYRDLVRLHVRPTPTGAVLIARLQPEDLEDLYAGRIVAGASPKSVELIHTVIRGALAQAARRGHALRNVGAMVRPPKVPRYRAAVLSAAQVRRLLDSAVDDRLIALWTLAAQTALRQGELLGLTLDDFDRERGALVLRNPEKGGKARRIRLPARSVRVLREHLARRAREQLAAGGAYETTGLLFAKLDGNRLDPRQVRVEFHRALERAGLPRIRFHDVRHSAATHLFEEGLTAKQIGDILGHQSTRTTEDIYEHVTEAMEDRAIAVMDRAYGG